MRVRVVVFCAHVTALTGKKVVVAEQDRYGGPDGAVEEDESERVSGRRVRCEESPCCHHVFFLFANCAAAAVLFSVGYRNRLAFVDACKAV